MKTPLIFLATTLLIAGCSTASNEIQSQVQDVSGFQNQSAEQLIKKIQETEEKLSKVSSIDDCKQFNDFNINQDCEVSFAFEEAEKGNVSYCNRLKNEEIQAECYASNSKSNSNK